MEIFDYFLDLLRGLLCHWCFEERVVLPVIKLNLALLYFIIFVHYDRCGALVCLFYYYFCVRSEFFKCYTFSERQVISWQWPLRTFLCPEMKQIISKSKTKPLGWKRCIDDVFSLWEKGRETINQFVLEANTHHPTIRFTAEISEKEIPFLDTTVFKGERFYEDVILDTRTHFKPTETFQYTHFNSWYAPGVKKGFSKGKAFRLLRTNSSKKLFAESINNLKSHLRIRGYPDNLVINVLAEVKFTDRESALQQKLQGEKNKLRPFVTQYNPSVASLKKVLINGQVAFN